MKRILGSFCCLIFTALFAFPANATLIGVSELAGHSSMGTAAAIIAAPEHILDDVVTNTGMQGFDEAQGVLTSVTHLTDDGAIAAGTLVDSHMIFLNSADDVLLTHFSVEWTFSGTILGIMSDRPGNKEEASTFELGNPLTNYPAAMYGLRGLETHLNGLCCNDGYSIINPYTLRVGMYVTEPGDWIRVVTEHTAVPEPATLLLLGSGLAGLGLVRRKFKA